MLKSRRLNSLAALTFIGLTTGAAIAAGPSSHFDLNGDVARRACMSVSLWTLLNDAGLITDPTIKNDVLRQYVEAIGSMNLSAA